MNCTSCLSMADECVWCTTLSTCLPMDTFQLEYQYGQCLHYQSSRPDTAEPATGLIGHSTLHVNHGLVVVVIEIALLYVERDKTLVYKSMKVLATRVLLLFCF